MNNGYIMDSVIGPILIVESDKGICEVSFSKDTSNIICKKTKGIEEAMKQLQDYFNGIRKTFSLPLDIQGTAFQVKTWQALLTIPYGTTWTYKQLANAIGNEKASRAVGHANNKNKLAIIIPCHRVIGASGQLVGYAGGLAIKEKLLQIEGYQK